MTSQPVPPQGLHPVLGCVAALTAALDVVEGVDPAWMSGVDKRAALVEISTVATRVEALRLRVLAAGQALGDVAEDDGSRDAAAWLAVHARLDPGRARHLTRLGLALQDRYVVLGAAVAAGRVDPAQADVIVRALDDLPPGLDPAIRHAAEQRLIDEAGSFDPRRLRILGRRVLAHLAPDLAEAHEADLLAKEEAHAEKVCFLRTRTRGDGTTDIHARVSDTIATRLLTYLHAFTNPRQPHHNPHPDHRQARPHPGPPQSPESQDGPHGPDDTDGADVPAQPAGPQAPMDRRPYDQKLGHAFAAFLETVDPDRMPLHGGDATTLIVTIDHHTLTRQLTDAGLLSSTAGTITDDTALIGDTPITAAHARRLACTANILPAVLGADSVVLDLGRTRRLYTPAQRKALALRHPTCAAAGCTIPAPWCEAHHAGTPWAAGGPTDLHHGTLLCSHHHHRAHDPRYDTTTHPHGTITFHRRT